MKNKPKGGGLFIVDNSEKWNVRRYLGEWCEYADTMDIASGYFEIGSLLSLDTQWQKLKNIRVLMGNEVTWRTQRAFDVALNNIKSGLNQSIESEKEENDFLAGVPAIVDALQNKKIICKVFREKKFHAKTFITHGKSDVVGSTALVGSSNFTKPGLEQNVELNVQIKPHAEVELLQQWFEKYWIKSEEISSEILKVIKKHTREYSPFEVYAKSLHELFKGRERTSDNWEQKVSKVYKFLSIYQREAYYNLLKIAERYNGAFLCDGVGLGKTFVGMMLLERLISYERQRVVLLVPKGARTPVWEQEIKTYLPNFINNPFISFRIYNHTDLLRGESKSAERDFKAEFELIKNDADVFIIDEGHHFRTHTSSRYKKLFDVIGGNKKVFLLTATPINNDIDDFRREIELFTLRNEKHFDTAPLNIHNLRGYFSVLKKQLRKNLNIKDPLIEPGYTSEETREILSSDKLFSEIVVQRSRSYVKKSVEQEIEKGGQRRAVIFPERSEPQVAKYSLEKIYGTILNDVELIFDKRKPLLKLGAYSPFNPRYFLGDPSKLEFDVLGRQQVVALVRVLLLKQFESSAQAFKHSCENLLIKLLSFVDFHDYEKGQIWRDNNTKIVKNIIQNHPLDEDDELEEDIVPDELKNHWKEHFEEAKKYGFSKKDFKIDLMIQDVLEDLEYLKSLLNKLYKIDPSKDDKVNQLINLLKKDNDLKKYKVLIFSQFRATTIHIKERLDLAGIKNIEQIDSKTTENRYDVIKRFSPYYNKTSSQEILSKGQKETRILISTDILAEGLNLQDATLLINYDLHWNPVRLMQRIGRIDRRLNYQTEIELVKDHPEFEITRGKVRFWNFLPPKELNQLLSLYKKITDKTLLISETFGIEGKKLLTPKDHYNAINEFNASYEGTTTKIEEMDLEYQKLLTDNPGLENKLEEYPLRVFSGKKNNNDKMQALFFCYKLPTEISIKKTENEKSIKEWTVDNGRIRWYLYNLNKNALVENTSPPEIYKLIKSEIETVRHTVIDNKLLKAARKEVEKHILNTYFKQAQVPLQFKNGEIIKPKLISWIELN